MYAQITELRAPLGKMTELRRLIQDDYFPIVRRCEGFVAGHLLEQVDDAEHAELVLFWDSQTAIEKMHRSETLQASLQTLAANLPGLRVRRQGYIVRVSVTEEADRRPAIVS